MGKVQATVQDFCESTSIHGCAYFFDKITILERVFWVTITLIMFIFAGTLISQSFVNWREQATQLREKVADTHVSEVQFPTVTICADFTPDRWGFVRAIFDMIRYQCSNAHRPEACSDNGNLRVEMNKDVDSLYRDIVIDNKDAIADDVALWNQTKILQNPTIFGHYLSQLNGQQSNLFIKHASEASMERKLFSLRNNLKTLAHWGINTSQPVSYHLNKESRVLATKTMATAAILIKVGLALATPGKVATWWSNHWQPDSFKDRNKAVRGFMTDPGPDSYFVIWALHLLRYMDGGNGVVVNAFDLAPILDPVPSYLAAHKFPRLFPYTTYVNNHFEHQDYLNALKTGIRPGFPFPPVLAKEHNYFGRILTPYRKIVMEAMYHCILRTRTFKIERYARNPKIAHLYVDEQMVQRFSMDIVDTGYYPKWSKFKWTKTPYWLPMAYNETNYLFEYSARPEDSAEYADETQEEMDRKDEVIDELRDKFQHQQMMQYCRGPGNSAESCRSKFAPVLTDKGICHAFNHWSFAKTFKTPNQGYFKTFAEIFDPDLNSSVVVNNQNSGLQYGMTIVLDSFSANPVTKEDTRGKFMVALNQYLNVANVRDVAVDVVNGAVAHIVFTPVIYRSSSAFKRLSQEVRKCRYTNENSNPNSIFTFYTQDTCKFECRLRYASAACKCTPWNYPSLSVEEPICDGELSYCFNAKMAEVGAESQACQCAPDCEGVQFDVSWNKYKFNYERECDEAALLADDELPKPDLGGIFAQRMRHLDGEEYYNQVQAFKRQRENRKSFDISSEEERAKLNLAKTIMPLDDYLLKMNYFHSHVNRMAWQTECKKHLEYSNAIIHIELAKPLVKTIERDAGASFVQKLSELGGNLGLCTGMSLLSFLELLFWTYKIVVKALSREP